MDDYALERNIEYTQKLRAMLKELPPFCSSFFNAMEGTTSPLTRYGYAMDLRTFFSFIIDEIPQLQNKTLREITLEDMNALSSDHIEMFIEHLTYYTDKNTSKQHENHDRAKARKLSALRSLFKYLLKKQKINNNVAALVDTPKLYDKPIIRLEPNEVADLLDFVDSGDTLTPKQRQYHSHTNCRDIAIMTVFLGTGIRISELIGLNISDIDFETGGFRITRKGGNQVVIYFGSEVEAALLEYIRIRKTILPTQGTEDALFLSMQRKRITPRAVQNLVKKYAKAAVPLKKISPHKLRSTYGTLLYQETGDIYLVADVLGHKDINTTKKHYAAQSDENRRKAARIVKLRDE